MILFERNVKFLLLSVFPVLFLALLSLLSFSLYGFIFGLDGEDFLFNGSKQFLLFKLTFGLLLLLLVLNISRFLRLRVLFFEFFSASLFLILLIVTGLMFVLCMVDIYLSAFTLFLIEGVLLMPSFWGFVSVFLLLLVIIFQFMFIYRRFCSYIPAMSLRFNVVIFGS